VIRAFGDARSGGNHRSQTYRDRISESRRPDSNRGPLHYEFLARPSAAIGVAVLSLQGRRLLARLLVAEPRRWPPMFAPPVTRRHPQRSLAGRPHLAMRMPRYGSEHGPYHLSALAVRRRHGRRRGRRRRGRLLDLRPGSVTATYVFSIFPITLVSTLWPSD